MAADDVGDSVAGTKTDDDETTPPMLSTWAAEEQPLNETASATATSEPGVELETPTNDALVLNSVNEKTLAESNASTSLDADEPTKSTGEKNIDDTTSDMAQPVSSNDDILSNFGRDNDGAVGVSNKDSGTFNDSDINQETSASNDFDLLGSPQAERASPPSDVAAVGGDSIIFVNNSAEKDTGVSGRDETISGLSGMPSGENGSNVQQQSSLAPNFPTEKEVEKRVDDSTPTDSIGENFAMNKNASAEKLVNTDKPEDESFSASKHDNSLSEKDGNVLASESHKDDLSVANVADLEQNKSTGESDANEEGMALVAANEAKPAEGEQVDELGDDAIVETSTEGEMQKISQEGTVNAVEKNYPQRTTETVIPEIYPSMQVNGEQTAIDADDNASVGNVNGDAEERTEEEDEWLSMGLGLGDALRQIVALTEERDSALVICKEKDDSKVNAEVLLVEVQSRLMAEMNGRAEHESEVRKVRETLKSYENRLKTYEGMEDDLEKAQANLVQLVTEKSKIEQEVQKLRELRDDSEQKEVVLSNRLNDAKKKEANRSTAAGRLEVDNEKLREDLRQTKDELENTSKAKAKLESNMEKLKAKAVERVKQADTALSEERELNEERKKKMKVFVETKAEELREAKESANDVQKELEETRASLRCSRDREEASQKELEIARLKHREVQRDMERMKRSSEQLHKMGNSLEQELEKSASETEEHKKKRMSAKHEIMQMVRTLEVERTVSAKLKESVKFTFTPKSQSQQELLTECLRDFELELEKLAAKMGKTLVPLQSETSEQSHAGPTGGDKISELSGASRKSKKTRAHKADMDTERLISNLEQETQHVSKGIMALAGSIERMRSLLDDDNMFGCMTYFSNILAGTGEARHQRLESDIHEENNADNFV
mmetsp:Transcript_3338/g.8503  ORF Transcript_3338/g.8503 Transcript_3338/m.8503 type:complete len:897 (+) Transcript_3338:122-2812(+)